MAGTIGTNPDGYEVTLLSFKVVPSSIKGRALDAFWTVERTEDSPVFTPTFNFCVAETASGPWHQVLETPTTDSAIYGIAHELLSHRPGRYVRLVVFDPEDRAIYATDPMDPTHQMRRGDYLEYREQLRLENLALAKVSGFKGYLFKKIITECPCECADEILDGAFDSHCPYCMGTGKVGGYHPPVEMMADWSDIPKGKGQQKETKVGISEVEQKIIKLMPYPVAAYKDIWVDSVSRVRYEVVKSEPVLYKIFPTAQRVVISLLPKTDPAYKLTIPIE